MFPGFPQRSIFLHVPIGKKNTNEVSFISQLCQAEIRAKRARIKGIVQSITVIIYPHVVP